MRRLPASLDDLRGLRYARWFRESTGRQWDNFGPEAQREQQDRAIERYGLTDTGIEWSVAHSGRTVASTAQFGDMIARAGTDYDVLLVGYVSRFARDARTIFNARHDLHLSGAAILFCDERILTSDEDRWDEFGRESVEAESYSRRLGKRVREGYGAKFRRLAQPGGRPPLGFRWVGERPRIMEIDPEAMPRVVAMFERYAVGTVSIEQLAVEFTLHPDQIKDLLRNPIYNGWVRRHGETAPAPWRSNPPVNDALWQRTVDIRARRTHGGGPKVPGRVDSLSKIIRCACGASLKGWGMVRGKHRRLHVGPCSEGVEKTLWATETWEPWVLSQLSQLRVDDKTIADVVAALRSAEPAQMPNLDRVRVERARRELAMQMADGRISPEDFVARLNAMPVPEEPTEAVDVAPDRAVARLRDFAGTWATLDDMGDSGRQLRADLVASVYDEITVRGDEFVSLRLTPSAYAHGFALALPERVGMALARPEGFSRARAIRRMPIVGAAEWRRAARRSA